MLRQHDVFGGHFFRQPDGATRTVKLEPAFLHALRLDRQNDRFVVALAHSDRRGFVGRQMDIAALTRNEALRPDGLQESSGRSVDSRGQLLLTMGRW